MTSTTTSSRTRSSGSRSTTSGASSSLRTSTTAFISRGRGATGPSRARSQAGLWRRSRARAAGGAVFFPDYPLYVAPRLVRERIPDATMSHFVHIPWPQPDYWRVLPESIRRTIHDGLLPNDLVSFHTERWCRNFLRCCEDILGAKSDFSAGCVTYR